MFTKNLASCLGNDHNVLLYHITITVTYYEVFDQSKVGLPPSKKICVICLNESPLKMMKNAFYFI